MSPRSRQRNHSRKDRISINIVPEQALDTESISPCLHWLFGENTESCYASRLVDEDSCEKQHHDTKRTKVEAAIMGEVADWWQSQHLDEFWAPRMKQQRKVVRQPLNVYQSLIAVDATNCESDLAATEIFPLFRDYAID